MSTAARIEELRKKFDENPRRYFAPLANELRKAGDLTQAIALCREHLPKQPGHMSGYIVFGQALFESGELDEARVVFEQALALDPENLIALHHLGHIARQQGDTAAARRWYERALETDARNDDIAHQLAALATPVRPQPAVPTPAPAAAVTPLWTPATAPSANDLDQELAFLDSGVLAPRRDLGAIPTPPYPQDAVGAIPLAPTPDAAMRAVDFDEVNARLQQSQAEVTPLPVTASAPATPDAPIDLDASPEIDLTVGDEAPMASDSAPVESASAPVLESLIDVGMDEPIDVDFGSDTSEPGFEATVETMPSAQAMADDPFAFDVDTIEPTAPASAEPPVEDIEAVFEEGLVAAGWSEGVDMATHAATPRSATPVSVDVPPEAAAAFGLEPQDPVVAELPEPEPDVYHAEADLDDRDVVANAEPVASEELPWLSAESEETSFFDVHPTPGYTETVPEMVVEEVHAEFSTPVEATEDATDEPTADEGTTDGESEAPAFVTETMGELLVAQGFHDRAVTVYEELVRRRPYDPVLSSRLEELRALASASEPTPVFTARERYATLAARRVSRRTPARSQTPAISSAAMSTPAMAPAIRPTPVWPTPALPTPTATSLGMSTPRAANAVPDHSLTALFSGEPDANDDAAARTLADAFAPMAIDEQADSGFPASFFTAAPAREATPAYGSTRQPTPMAATPSIPTPVAPAAAVTAPDAEFSFDRFFPDPATNAPPTAARATPNAGSAAAPEAGAASDDLAQFSAWLKGLGNS